MKRAAGDFRRENEGKKRGDQQAMYQSILYNNMHIILLIGIKKTQKIFFSFHKTIFFKHQEKKSWPLGILQISQASCEGHLAKVKKNIFWS